MAKHPAKASGGGKTTMGGMKATPKNPKAQPAK